MSARRPGRRRRSIRAAAATTVVLAGCTGVGNGSAALPPGPPTVSVIMQEYRFEHAQQAPRGRVLFRATNVGSTRHELTMVRLDADQFLTVKERVRGQALATVLVLPTREPGGDDIFAVDLVPGRYGFICFTKDGDGVDHLTKGMASELLVL